MKPRFPIPGLPRNLVLVMAGMMLAACAETEFLAQTAKRVSKAEVPGEAAVPGIEGQYKIGKAYEINGVWYYPAVDYDYEETGISSWYGSEFHGRRTANGEWFDMNRLSAAHRTLPLPSFVRVTNLENGRSLVLRVNDRGPFAHGRILDVSRRAAQLLGFEVQGTARVRVQILAAESRAIAARLQNQATLASAGTPITVNRIPSVAVKSETLPPPSGAVAAEALPGRSPIVSASTTIEEPRAPDPVLGVVTQGPVAKTRIFVQAGAFAQYHNANQTRARLASLGPVEISSVLVDDRDLFRVRLGPLTSVEEADGVLERVIHSGYNDARIVVVD
jgi:rare lipoprotein A